MSMTIERYLEVHKRETKDHFKNLNLLTTLNQNKESTEATSKEV